MMMTETIVSREGQHPAAAAQKTRDQSDGGVIAATTADRVGSRKPGWRPGRRGKMALPPLHSQYKSARDGREKEKK
jgi:hypothetical protein